MNIPHKYIRIIDTKEGKIEEDIKKLSSDDFNIKLVLGFVSPHINFENTEKKIKSRFLSNVKNMLTTTAGEICTLNL